MDTANQLYTNIKNEVLKKQKKARVSLHTQLEQQLDPDLLRLTKQHLQGNRSIEIALLLQILRVLRGYTETA